MSGDGLRSNIAPKQTVEREYGSSLFHTIEKPKWVKVVFIFLGTTDRQILEGGFSFYLPSASNGNSTLIIAEFLDGGDTSKCGKKYWGDEGLTTTIASSGEMSEM